MSEEEMREIIERERMEYLVDKLEEILAILVIVGLLLGITYIICLIINIFIPILDIISPYLKTTVIALLIYFPITKYAHITLKNKLEKLKTNKKSN